MGSAGGGVGGSVSDHLGPVGGQHRAPGAAARLRPRNAVGRLLDICCPPSPAGNRQAPSCASRASPGSWQDGDRPLRRARTGRRLVPCCRHGSWPPSGTGLGAVPVPRIKEIFGPGTFTRPIPEQAAVLGQRGRQVLRPNSCNAVGGASAAGHGRAICRRRQLPAGTSRSHHAQPAECGCDLAVSIGSADRPGAQNCRSRATWTAQPTDRTWRQIRRVRARSRIGIRCARPRPVTGRKLRAAGQTMDAAHASAVPSKARCSPGSVSTRVEIHGLDRPRARRRSAGAAEVLIFTTSARQCPASASFQSLMNQLAATPCTTNGSLFGELLSGAAGVTANDKGFLAPLWAFSGRRGTSECDRALRERCISYLWPCTGFQPRHLKGTP